MANIRKEKTPLVVMTQPAWLRGVSNILSLYERQGVVLIGVKQVIFYLPQVKQMRIFTYVIWSNQMGSESV